jgi:hypothetical protein
MRIVLPALLIAFLTVQTASADLATLGAAHDASVFSTHPDNSHGAGPGICTGADGGGQMLRGLLQFDVAGAVPAGSTVTSVQLTLSLGAVAGSGLSADTGNRTIELHRLLASWGEGSTESSATGIGGTGNGAPANAGDATWTDRFFSSTTPTGWVTPGGDFVTTASATTAVGTTANLAYTWSSTPTLVADVQGWLNNPAINAGWLLRNADESTPKTYRAFWTREASNPSLRPQLQITYTPAPEPAGVTVLGATVLVLVRRRIRP